MTNRELSGSPQALYRLNAPIKDYAWGSTTLLAELTGNPPTAQPQAEKWFGTHPTTPTLLDDGTPLAELAELPYLVKLLAAEQPLSIQAHPSVAQAKVGFAAENAAGIPLADPQRTYRDANHKPEMLVALTPFTALAGFRDPSESAQTFATLASLVDDVPLANTLSAMAAQLVNGEVSDVFGQLVDTNGLFWQSNGWTTTIFAAVAASQTTDEYLLNALATAKFHPADPGAVVTLLMNLVHLEPGDAIFIPNGTIHAYYSGLGLEVMATSDNVIRGGLTHKHVDIAELAKVVKYHPGPPPYLTPKKHQRHRVAVTEFTPPVTDFALTRYDLPAKTTMTFTPDRPHLAVCSSGTGKLTSTNASLEVSPGDGFYIPGHGHSVELSSSAGVTMFMASQP